MITNETLACYTCVTVSVVMVMLNGSHRKFSEISISFFKFKIRIVLLNISYKTLPKKMYLVIVSIMFTLFTNRKVV